MDLLYNESGWSRFDGFFIVASRRPICRSHPSGKNIGQGFVRGNFDIDKARSCSSSRVSDTLIYKLVVGSSMEGFDPFLLSGRRLFKGVAKSLNQFTIAN